jgi:hypothetical protein
MDWIKKNTHQFALALVALLLLACSVLIFLKTQSFAEGFSAAMTAPAHSKEVPKLDTSVIDSAQQRLAAPHQWEPKPGQGSLFVSWPLLRDKTTGQLSQVKDRMQNPPVPNNWLTKYDLDPLGSTVLRDDPDQDGFSNLDEYLGADRQPPTDPNEVNAPADATNPKDKNSHPPYYTKLVLKRYIKVPFRLQFDGIDGDPLRDKPEAMSYQINTKDLRQPSEFLKLGEMVRNTKFKLMKFQYKTRRNESIGEDEDVSELTLHNVESDEDFVLIWRKETDSPDSYALFDYLWPNAASPQPIQVKKRQEFVLKPNIQERYKLIDIKETEAVIQLPTGEKYPVLNGEKYPYLKY